MEPTYPTQPEALIPAKCARLIAELAAFESLFEMRLGVTINCGDIRLIRPVDGNYTIQEQRPTNNGTTKYLTLSIHSDIAAAVIAFRAAVIGPSKPDTVEFDETTGVVSIVKS